MFGVEPLGAVFLAENAVIGQIADDQRPHRLLGRPVGDGDGVEGRALELVLHGETRTEMRQDRRAGGVGEPVEKGDERVVAVGIAHGRSSNDAPPLQCDEPRPEASAGEPADRCPPRRPAVAGHRRAVALRTAPDACTDPLRWTNDQIASHAIHAWPHSSKY